jgi:N-acetylglutamate synthase-like GNAT family acetyltransferase
VSVELDGTLLALRQQEWDFWQANPAENPLSTRVDFAGGEVLLENELCVYVQDSRYGDGLAYSGFIVTRRPCETVFDLTPEEAAATHALLAEVRAHLDASVQPDGYTAGWNVFPAGGAHLPHVHLHVIARWNSDLAAGAGLRYFLKAAAQVSGTQPSGVGASEIQGSGIQAVSIRPARPEEMGRVRALADTLTLGASSATSEGSTYWLALCGDDLVGCIGLEYGEGVSLIRTTCVRPDMQGQGVGGQLARVALSAARGRGDRTVYLFSSHAGPYWERLGFAQVPVSELSAALPAAPQVQSGLTRGWIHDETAWKLEFSG